MLKHYVGQLQLSKCDASSDGCLWLLNVVKDC